MNEIEKAIVALNDIHEGWSSWVPQNDSLAHKNVQALGISIDSLREKQERSKGCNHCKEDSCELCFNAGYYIICEDGMNETCEYFQKMNYCPNCGADMRRESEGGT